MQREESCAVQCQDDRCSVFVGDASNQVCHGTNLCSLPRVCHHVLHNEQLGLLWNQQPRTEGHLSVCVRLRAGHSGRRQNLLPFCT